ncbi:hypothetical protein E1293_34930 [Actinomadura darangshiensis]|uniref:Pyridoxamine 5'-phosphate oxidase family protein n=1 Tax=Actinomadura darangshiensis TaxID=705336 RepID=A0A4R5AHB3_9ACTN|nr:hypothetical protein [Actinomadura darangshiensis]TDD70324.1 hypothetical protein E1293_34930 [Actinomadura darangshiensis]
MVLSSEVLPAAVRAIDGAPSRQRPVVLITCGADGAPRACVPDWGELRVVDERRLRVAIWPSDPTAVNLDHDAPALLIVTALSDVYLVHATPRRLVDAAMVWAHYELTITSAHIADRGTTPPPHLDTDVLAQRAPKADAMFDEDEGAPLTPASVLNSVISLSPISRLWKEGIASMRRSTRT